MSSARRPPNLWNPRVSARDADQRPVLGEMAGYVGHHYTEEEVWRFHQQHVDVYPDEEAGLRPLARRIRAFDVPLLSGVAFQCRRLEDLAVALEQVVAERLRGIVWEPFDQARSSRVKKYGIIHEVTPAPVDEATDDAMALELFGRLESLNAESIDRDWYRRRWPEHPPADDVELGDLAFRLIRGTYANTSTPGVGVPFYL